MTISFMFGSGFLLGIILDVYRVLTIRFRLKGWVLSFIDLMYWLVSAGLVFGLLFWSNWGEWRLYLFLAVVIGFFLYHRWVSQWVIRILKALFQQVEKVLRWLVRLLYTVICIPTLGLIRFIQMLLRGLLRLLKGFAKILLVPFIWLTRPIHQPIQAFVRPIINKCHRIFSVVFNWFRQIRKKG